MTVSVIRIPMREEVVESTPTSTDWAITRLKIIERALTMVGYTGVKGAPSGSYEMAEDTLNSIVKNLQADNVFLWAEEEVTKTFGASSEVTGSDSAIYTCYRTHTSSVDNEPVTGAEWSKYWKLRGETGGTWQSGLTYSSIGEFAPDIDTLSVTRAFIRRSDTDVPLDIIGRDEFQRLCVKQELGNPTKLYFRPLTTPRIFLYPQPSDTDMILVYWAEKKLDDMDTHSGEPVFPRHWIEPLVYALASALGDIHGIDLNRVASYEAKYFRLKGLVNKRNFEKTSKSVVASAY
jgi:hypothetical protein